MIRSKSLNLLHAINSRLKVYGNALELDKKSTKMEFCYIYRITEYSSYCVSIIEVFVCYPRMPRIVSTYFI